MMITFQEVILRLQEYLESAGLRAAAADRLEVGAGTSPPRRSCGLLVPEPWRAAYVQPPRVVRRTAVTKIPIVCSSTISIKWF